MTTTMEATQEKNAIETRVGAPDVTSTSAAIFSAKAAHNTKRILDPRLAVRIRQHTTSYRRADYIDALKTFEKNLTRIPLSITCDVDTAQAFRDAIREVIMLNGVRFIGDYRTEAFVAAVKRIVAR
jgi:hypothetical protein